MEYTIIVKENKDGWLSGQCEQFPEAITQGEDMDDLMLNMKDAIELVLLVRQEEFRKSHKLLKSDKRKTLIIGNEKNVTRKTPKRKGMQTV